MRKVIAIIVLGLAAAVAVAGCKSSSGNAAAGASSARGALASATSDPTVQADIALAKAGIERCLTGTPLQQLHTLHVVLLERANGKNGAEVRATRSKLFGCLGVPASRQDQFKNDSLTAAGKQHPRVWTKAGIRTYALVTWPGILARYQKAGAAS